MSPSGLERTSWRHCITGAILPVLCTHCSLQVFMSASRFISFDCSPYSEVLCRGIPRPPPQSPSVIFRDLHVNEPADYFDEDSEAQSNIYPNEFVNTLLPSGMPQHRLNLKVGAPIILIRNLNRAAGLMNGTRLSVTSCLRYTIQATVLARTQKGNSVCITRINLTLSDDDDLPIKFIRRQFPVKLAFCMIKKVPTRTGPRCAPSACNPCRFAPDQRLHCSKSKVPNPKI